MGISGSQVAVISTGSISEVGSISGVGSTSDVVSTSSTTEGVFRGLGGTPRASPPRTAPKPDPAAQDEVLVEVEAGRGFRARGSRAWPAARSGRGGSGGRRGRRRRRTAALCRRRTRPRASSPRGARSKGVVDPFGEYGAADGRHGHTLSCRGDQFVRRAGRAPSRRPPWGQASGRSADGWLPRRIRSTCRTGLRARDPAAGRSLSDTRSACSRATAATLPPYATTADYPEQNVT